MPAAIDPGLLILIALAAAVAVIFWRAVITLMIIGVVMLVLLGFAELLQGLH